MPALPVGSSPVCFSMLHVVIQAFCSTYRIAYSIIMMLSIVYSMIGYDFSHGYMAFPSRAHVIFSSNVRLFHVRI